MKILENGLMKVLENGMATSLMDGVSSLSFAEYELTEYTDSVHPLDFASFPFQKMNIITTTIIKQIPITEIMVTLVIVQKVMDHHNGFVQHQLGHSRRCDRQTPPLHWTWRLLVPIRQRHTP